MKAVVAAFNQEKALVGAFSVLTNLRMELFQALVNTALVSLSTFWSYPAVPINSDQKRPAQISFCSLKIVLLYAMKHTVSPAGLEVPPTRAQVGLVGEKTRVRIRSSHTSRLQTGGSDGHLIFFAHLPHLGPSGGDFKASRRNCIFWSLE